MFADTPVILAYKDTGHDSLPIFGEVVVYPVPGCGVTCHLGDDWLRCNPLGLGG